MAMSNASLAHRSVQVIHPLAGLLACFLGPFDGFDHRSVSLGDCAWAAGGLVHGTEYVGQADGDGDDDEKGEDPELERVGSAFFDATGLVEEVRLVDAEIWPLIRLLLRSGRG